MEAGANDLSIKQDRSCSVTALPAIHPADFPGDDPAIALRDYIYGVYCDELGAAGVAEPLDAAADADARAVERAQHA